MNLESLWKSVLAELELVITPAVFKTALASSGLESLEKSVATISINNPVMRSMIESRYYALIKNSLDEKTGENVSLVFSLSSKKPAAINTDPGPLFRVQETNLQTKASMVAKKMHIRPDSTFDSFAVSSTNQIAYAAATAVAKNPGISYNPLFLYGGVGVGKTHLMHAVANALLNKNPATKVVYCTGEDFLNGIVEAIQTKTSRQFKQKYRTAELLLVDDVQFIAGKQTAQEEFFHTFNAVQREGAQIILTSDRPPTEISKLEDRLRSRFDGGLTVDVAPPDFELRVAILNIKSQSLNLSIPTNASHIIAGAITDTRAIEGFLRKLQNEMQATKKEISNDMVIKLLKISPSQVSGGGEVAKINKITPTQILELVADRFNIKPMHLKGPKRDRPIVVPRQIVMYLCMTELNVTLDDVGGLLGGRDHSTVMHGVDKITRELEKNPQLRSSVEELRSHLLSN